MAQVLLYRLTLQIPSAATYDYPFFLLFPFAPAHTPTLHAFQSPIIIAARPRVIPLYATPILNRPRRILSIHHVLPAKPYARAERNGLESPALTAVSSGSSTESGAMANVGALLSEPRLILIPPPNANVTVKSSGWHAASAKEYRVSSHTAFFNGC
ncbi:hypothetical protein F5050DRAFT_1898793 [Lentinula boryana]|uniref:Uncharacterized protein n=1 Tax=Lentinula boryana TaxID=40481 RepID=A0ABQ8PWK6_9AGAR|nr:hypothetical protein F5050DRAFT_1898793 [Lentinula boryana]